MYTNISNINSLADCTALLSLANEIKSDIEFKRTSKDRIQNSLETRSTDLNQSIDATQYDLDKSIERIATLSEGDEKEAEITKKIGLEYQLRKLNEKVKNYGQFAVILKDNEVDRLEAELLSHQTFLDSIQTRITELSATSN
jgi:hypothetical protein